MRSGNCSRCHGPARFGCSPSGARRRASSMRLKPDEVAGRSVNSTDKSSLNSSSEPGRSWDRILPPATGTVSTATVLRATRQAACVAARGTYSAAPRSMTCAARAASTLWISARQRAESGDAGEAAAGVGAAGVEAGVSQPPPARRPSSVRPKRLTG
jgi:hypothetical protein